jgi:hypothetical protein
MTIQANFPNVQPSLLLDFANAKQLPPQVTFTRATSATYYDGSTTAKAEQNLVTYSQEFDNAAWIKESSTVTANSTAAPDGTTTADTLTASAATASHLMQRLVTTVASEPQGYSIYAKYSTAQYIGFGFTSGGLSSAWAYVTVDIQNGTITQTTNGGGAGITISGSIASVGNGWYRIQVLGNYTQTNTYPTILIVDTGTPSYTAFGNYPWAATGTEAVFIWGAQMEQRSAATAYTATTTQPITNYVPVLLTAGGGQPRFDHNPTTSESLGLEIEEQRTNLHRYSAAFDGTVYTVEAGSYLNNTIVSPSGDITGAAIIEGNTFYTRSTIAVTVTTSTEYTYSAYFKKGLRSQVLMEMYTNSNDGTAVFDLVAGTVVGGDVARATITDVGNGWYRCTLRSTTTGTSLSLFSYPAIGGSYSYTHVEGATGIFIWGAQLEQSSFATSYIPTTTAAATRAADDVSITGNNFTSWFSSQQGTIYIESNFQKIGTRTPAQFGSSFTNRYGYYFASDVLTYFDGSSYIIVSGLSSVTKIAGTLTINDIAASCNNSSAYALSGATSKANVNFLQIGNGIGVNEIICGTIKKLAYYPVRVTNAQLQALTS